MIICIMSIMKKKNITIRDDQAKFIVKISLNLSRFVQKKIDELIEDYKDKSFMQEKLEEMRKEYYEKK